MNHSIPLDSYLIWSHVIAGSDNIVSRVLKVLDEQFSSFFIVFQCNMVIHRCLHVIDPPVCSLCSNIIICMSSNKSSVLALLLSTEKEKRCSLEHALKMCERVQSIHFVRSLPVKIWTTKCLYKESILHTKSRSNNKNEIT